jgi:tripartite-type tricarboxylate transporter receptor subunit TctC
MKHILLGFFAFLLFSVNAFAWQPSKPVNIYIGAGAGTTAEIAARRITEDITRRPGVTFIYHYMPGPGQIRVTNEFLTMPKDGHHLLMPFFGDVFIWSELLYKNSINWNLDSFEYVIGLPSDPAAIIAPLNSPINTPSDMIKYLNSPPKNINIGTGSGTQAIPYHALMHFGKGDVTKVQEIRYKAAREVLAGVAAGDLDFGVIPAGLINSAEATGKIKVIGITAGETFKNAPQHKLFKSEIDNLVFYIYRLIVLPKGTDTKIVEWFNKNMRIALENPDIVRHSENNFETIKDIYLTPAGIRQTVINAKRIYQPIAEKNIPR